VILSISMSFAAAASNLYIAQNAAGGNTGADCADAHAASWFNSGGNWGSGTSQIGPGTTVHLCGTITSALTAQGSGNSSSPITILFDSATSGNISMPAIPTSGAIVVSGSNYITIDGNNQVGIIQSTNNGSPQGGYANQVPSVAIAASGAGNITVQNLQMLNLYVHSSPLDESAGGSMGVGPPSAVYFPNATGAITLNNVVMTYCAACVNGNAPPGIAVTVSNSTCNNFDHCLGMGNQSNSAQVLGPVYFFNNTIENTEPWDTTQNNFHHDGVHLWAYCSDGSSYCAGTYWNSIYIYNNHFFGSLGQNFNSWIFNEENIRNEWTFNNIIDTSSMPMQNGAGPAYAQGNTIHFVDNTFLGNTGAGVTNLNMGGPSVTNQNNVNCNAQLTSITSTDESGTQNTSITALNHNYYMSGNGNAFIWKGTFLSFSGFPAWESDSGETNSSTSSGCTVNSDGSLQANSIAIGGGTNLYSTCNGQPSPGLGALCSDQSGNPRPSSGSWDAGALSYNSSAPPAPPTGVTATVE
jgi:hypothetical protein